jgi:GT2 family glycosyltransferase
MRMSGLHLSFLLPNYNGASLLSRCFPSVVAAAERGGCDVIVVDDASTDGSVAWLHENAPQVRVVRNPKNRGFASTANRGVGLADTEWVMLLNTDVRVESDIVRRVLPYLDGEDLFAVTFRADNIDGVFREGAKGLSVRNGLMKVHHWPDRWPSRVVNGSRTSAYAVGAHAVFHRRRFLKLGGFDSIYHPAYSEDTDLGYRAWRCGYAVVYADDVRVSHHHFGAIATRYSVTSIWVMKLRNRILFTESSLTDARYLWELRLLVALRLPVYVLSRPDFIRGLIAALPGLIRARARRTLLKLAAVRSHREVMQLLSPGDTRDD